MDENEIRFKGYQYIMKMHCQWATIDNEIIILQTFQFPFFFSCEMVQESKEMLVTKRYKKRQCDAGITFNAFSY